MNRELGSNILEVDGVSYKVLFKNTIKGIMVEVYRPKTLMDIPMITLYKDDLMGSLSDIRIHDEFYGRYTIKKELLRQIVVLYEIHESSFKSLAKMFYIDETEGINIRIDLGRLLFNRKEIVSTYQIHNELSSEMINRFLPQIIEEIFEYQQELVKVNYFNPLTAKELPEDAKYELVDIILYLGSILAEFTYKLNPIGDFFTSDPEGKPFDEYKISLTEEILKELNSYQKFSSNDARSMKLAREEFLMNSDLPNNLEAYRLDTQSLLNLDHLVYGLGRIRAEYPDRKYHKPLEYNELIKNYDLLNEFERTIKVYGMIVEMIFLCLMTIIESHLYIKSMENFDTEFNYEEVIERALRDINMVIESKSKK